MREIKNFVSVALKGMGMGIAETIPGVSGGTIAFISGVYDKLLGSINSLNLGLITIFKNEGVKGVWEKINGAFLVALMSGMVIGIGVGLVIFDKLLEEYPPLVWSFFFGLVIASIYYVLKQVGKIGIEVIFAFVLGAIIAYGITMLPIASASDNLFFVFISGAIAVSALILPGVSGSFILLVMGMYSFILHDTLKDGLIKNHEMSAFIIMAVFGVGMLVGLLSISRFLSWALKSYHAITLALLSGFMLGALNKLWPWRIPSVVMNHQDEIVEYTKGMEVDKVIKEVSVMPGEYAQMTDLHPFVIGVILSGIFGFILIFGIEILASKLSKK